MGPICCPNQIDNEFKDTPLPPKREPERDTKDIDDLKVRLAGDLRDKFK